MPTVFSDLLAPCESARRQLIRQEIQIPFFIYADQSANKELKSGSLAPPLPSCAARRQRPTSGAPIFGVAWMLLLADGFPVPHTNF